MDSKLSDRPKGLFGSIGRKQFSMFAMLIIVTACAVAATIFAAQRRKLEQKKFVERFKTFVWQDNPDEVDRMLKVDPSLAHGREHYGVIWRETALQMAAESPDVFHRILKENPNLEEVSDRGETALTAVASAEKVLGSHVVVPMLEELIRRGADVNGGKAIGSPAMTLTPIQAAALAINVDARNQNYRSSIANRFPPTAIINGVLPKPAPSSLDVLLKARADITLTHRSDEKSCLHLAVAENHADAVRTLVAAGADVNATDKTGETPLHVAMINGGVNLAQVLVSHGADPVAADKSNRIPGEVHQNCLLIFNAILQGHNKGDLTTPDAMLKAAPQVLKWTGNASLLVKAATLRRADIVEYLLSRGVDSKVTYSEHANRGNVKNLTVLHALAKSSHNSANRSSIKPIVGMLVESGVDVNAKDSSQTTPLHWAAGGRLRNMLEALIESGADVNAKDNSQSTPLHWAARHQSCETLEALIKNGADVYARDSAGKSAMDEAIIYFAGKDSVRILETLIQAGHETNAFYAAVMGNIELLEELKRQDPELLFRTYTTASRTPLFAAVMGQQVEAIEWLLEQGADPNTYTGRESLLLMAWNRTNPFSFSTGFVANQTATNDPINVALALIEGGIDIDARQINFSAIRQSAKGGNERAKRVVEWLDGLDLDFARPARIRFPSS